MVPIRYRLLNRTTGERLRYAYPITVNLRVWGDPDPQRRATRGTDYQIEDADLRLFFAANDTEETIVADIFNDDVTEGKRFVEAPAAWGEAFALSVINAPGALIDNAAYPQGAVFVQIVDDDGVTLNVDTPRGRAGEGETLDVVAFFPRARVRCDIAFQGTMTATITGHTVSGWTPTPATQTLAIPYCNESNIVRWQLPDNNTDDNARAAPTITVQVSAITGGDGERLNFGGRTYVVKVEDDDGAGEAVYARPDYVEIRPTESMTTVRMRDNDLYVGGDPARLRTEIISATQGLSYTHDSVAGALTVTPTNTEDQFYYVRYRVSDPGAEDASGESVVSIHAQGRASQQWAAAWSSSAITEGETTTLTLTHSNQDTAPIANDQTVGIAMYISKKRPGETLIEPNDITVTTHDGRSLEAHALDTLIGNEFDPQAGRVGSWVYITTTTKQQAATETLRINARADSTDEPAETMTVRVYVSGTDAGTNAITVANVNSENSTEVEPPTVTETPAVSAAGSDGQWTEGETVEVTLGFSEAVEVDTANGVPSVGIGLGLGGAPARSAAYVRGGGTAELVFGYTLVAGDGDHTVMAVTLDSLALNGGAIRSVATGADAALEHNGTAVQGGRPRSPEGPSARFEGVPANHNGSDAFTVELHFSVAPEGLSDGTVAGGLLEATGGTVTSARQLNADSNLAWEVTVRPDGAGDIQLRLPVRKCGSPNAVCIDNRPLAQAAGATVPGTPLTASFSNVPAEHDGTRAVELEFRLSEEPPGLSFRTVHNGLFDVSGGTIKRAWRLRKGNNEGWGIRVKPSGFGDVTLALRATTDCAGTPGVCTRDGRKLAGGLQATIAGPATLSVADAEVDEASGAVLDFTVTLSRRLMETVTVEYGTADGTASAGADYTNTSGTLTFAAGDTSKTVAVPVLDDELDEGSETLTLTLSNPAPTRVKLADAEATGTISNTDAMPKAWIARFGRTVAEHVLDAVEARREAWSKPGMEVSLAGQRIGGAALPEDVAGRQEAERGRSLSDWLKGGTDPQRQDLGSRTITEHDLLTGSSFALTAETQSSGLVSIWGRGAVTRFSGREGDLSVDGEVATGMLGADWTEGAWKAGLLVSHSLGDGGYRGAGAGTMTSTLTGIFPWVRHALNERLSVWGVAGYGEGSLTLEPEEQAKIRTDLDLWMAAAGLRGVLVDGGHDGPTLAVDTDAMIVRTSSDAVSGGTGNLAAAEAEVTRLRLGLEGSQRFRVGDGATLTPSVEIGVRHDGGDAETGFGVDIGGGLAWSDTRRGITAAFRGRALLTHEADGFRERGPFRFALLGPAAGVGSGSARFDRSDTGRIGERRDERAAGARHPHRTGGQRQRRRPAAAAP